MAAQVAEKLTISFSFWHQISFHTQDSGRVRCHLPRNNDSVRQTAHAYYSNTDIKSNFKLHGVFGYSYNSASDPVCGSLNSDTLNEPDQFLTIADHENTSMQCSVKYSGNWVPTMTWKRVCGGEVDENLRSNLYVDGSSVASTLIFTSDRKHHGCNYSCLTFFEKPASPKFVSNSSHCPRFRHSCYIQLNVLCT